MPPATDRSRIGPLHSARRMTGAACRRRCWGRRHTQQVSAWMPVPSDGAGSVLGGEANLLNDRTVPYRGPRRAGMIGRSARRHGWPSIQARTLRPGPGTSDRSRVTADPAAQPGRSPRHDNNEPRAPRCRHPARGFRSRREGMGRAVGTGAGQAPRLRSARPVPVQATRVCCRMRPVLAPQPDLM